jgi:hypothetical protein
MKKRSKVNMLTYLYVKLAINKLSIISICISYLILLGYLIFITCFEYDETSYMSMYNDIHQAYIRNSSFIGIILNSIILIVLIISIFVDITGFDSVHIPIANRGSVLLSKLLAIFILIFIISLISFSLIIILAEIFYPNFQFSTNHSSIFLYFIFSLFIQLAISVLMLSIINSSFISITGFFITFVMLFIGTNYDRINGISYLIPILDQNNLLKNVPYVGIAAAILSLLIYSIVYDTKNIT